MAKMTSGEIGAKIGRSESYVSLLRRGKRTPSVDRLLVIVEVFGLKWEDVGPKLEQGPEVFGPWLDEVAFTVPDKVEDDQEPPAASLDEIAAPLSGGALTISFTGPMS